MKDNNYSNLSIREVRIETMEEFNNQILDRKFNYFRGETDARWQLNSSMVRKLKLILKNESDVLDFKKLEDITKEYRNIYDQVISSRHSFSRFLFYLQHSISFSPFIDITKDVWIAVSFCLADVQLKSDRSIDKEAAIYAFELKTTKSENPNYLTTHEEILDVLKQLSIGINKDNMNKKLLKTYVIDSSDLNILNDRMHYQKGAFLLMNDYSIGTSNKTHQNYDASNIAIHKFILSKDLLEKLFFKLRSNFKEYTIEYLNNPYKLFELNVKDNV